MLNNLQKCQYRLIEWAEQIRDCKSCPSGMSVAEWKVLMRSFSLYWNNLLYQIVFMEVDVASDDNGIKIVHIKNTSGERLKNTVLGRVF